MRSAVAAIVVFVVLAAPAAAQPRVILLDEMACPLGRPRMPLEWVIARADPCPGDTMLRLCGGAVADTCTPIATAAASIGDAGIDACRADAALLPAANALYDEIETREAARRLYRVLASVPSIRAIALYRAGRAATGRSLYADAVRAYGELLDGRTSGALRDAAVRQLAGILAYDDQDEDARPDPEFPDTTLSRAFLPERPWSREVAVGALEILVETTAFDAGARALDTIARRWPRDDASDLDSLRADMLERSRRYDELTIHLFTAADHCAAREAPCEREFLDRAQRIARAQLAECGPAAAPEAEPIRLRACLAGVSTGEQVLARRPSASLSLDVADAAAWVGDAVARASARAASSSRDASIRAQSAARLATPVVAAPPPLRTTIAPTPEPVVEGDLDVRAVERAITVDALRACAPRGAATLRVHVVVAEDGTISSVDASPAGRTATCVARALNGIRAAVPDGGAASVDGVIVYAPGAG